MFELTASRHGGNPPSQKIAVCNGSFLFFLFVPSRRRLITFNNCCVPAPWVWMVPWLPKALQLVRGLTGLYRFPHYSQFVTGLTRSLTITPEHCPEQQPHISQNRPINQPRDDAACSTASPRTWHSHWVSTHSASTLQWPNTASSLMCQNSWHPCLLWCPRFCDVSSKIITLLCINHIYFKNLQPRLI